MLRPLSRRHTHVAAPPLQPTLLHHHCLQLCIAGLAREVHALCPVSIRTKRPQRVLPPHTALLLAWLFWLLLLDCSSRCCSVLLFRCCILHGDVRPAAAV